MMKLRLPACFEIGRLEKEKKDMLKFEQCPLMNFDFLMQ